MRLNVSPRFTHRAFCELTRALWVADAAASAGSEPAAPQPIAEPEPVTPAVPVSKPQNRPERAVQRRELPAYRVLLHNDDHVSMDHVVRCITSLTPLPRGRAHVVMLMAHTQGVALMLITHRERAELYQQQFRSKGLIVTLEPMD